MKRKKKKKKKRNSYMPNLFQKAELKKSTQVTIQLSEYITGCQHYVANSGTKEEQEEELKKFIS